MKMLTITEFYEKYAQNPSEICHNGEVAKKWRGTNIMGNRLTNKRIEAFKMCLLEEERSILTVEKYIRDVRGLQAFLGKNAVSKQLVIEYKQQLIAQYKPASANSMLAAVNRFLDFCGLTTMKVRTIKVQRNLFASPERELTRHEYDRLLRAARRKENERLNLVMQTICSTGIRVSELQYITVELVQQGRGEVVGKGKRRMVFLRPQLKALLLSYAKRSAIKSGAVFLSRNGNPLNRHSIWADMKTLCVDAEVDSQKVFPHNLRHLFAKTFYAIEKDLLRLADILGHSSVNTTRIYTADCGSSHMKLLEKMQLLM